MLYYNGELVNWKKGTSDTEKAIRAEMHELEQKYFSKDAPGYAVLRYPHGIRRKNVSGYYEPAKVFIIDHFSSDNMWVFTRHKKAVMKDGVEEFIDKYTVIRDPYIIQHKDIEFLWFLLNHCYALKGKRVYIEDKEAEAAKVANERASDVDIKYMIYGKTSPFTKNKELFRQIATVLGIREVNRLGEMQLKNAVYGVISDGEKRNHSFINFDTFEKLVNGNSTRRTSYVVRSAINDGTLKWHPKEMQWYLAAGGEYVDGLLQMTLQDVTHKEERLLEAVLRDGTLRATIFSALGKTDYESADELREFERTALVSMCSKLGVTFDIKDKKEEIVEKLCEHFGMEYKPKSS